MSNDPAHICLTFNNFSKEHDKMFLQNVEVLKKHVKCKIDVCKNCTDCSCVKHMLF